MFKPKIYMWPNKNYECQAAWKIDLWKQVGRENMHDAQLYLAIFFY